MHGYATLQTSGISLNSITNDIRKGGCSYIEAIKVHYYIMLAP